MIDRDHMINLSPIKPIVDRVERRKNRFQSMIVNVNESQNSFFLTNNQGINQCNQGGLYINNSNNININNNTNDDWNSEFAPKFIRNKERRKSMFNLNPEKNYINLVIK